ncbi:MAG: pilus assembly protein TadG-related protein [Actinomycetota bacterium]
MLGRLNRDEGGAVLVIVALSLIALFAMAVLSVDVGGLYAARRSMVNGADAAALAAAQTCITQDQDPQAVALTYAQHNVDAFGLKNVAVTAPVVCDYATKTVTVSIAAQQQLYFAPVLGFNDQGRVATTATAKWGPTGSASPIPLVIYQGTFQGHNCDIPYNVAKGTTCYLWEDNDFNVEGQGNFGFIDISHSVAKDAHCPGVGQSQLADWISGTDPLNSFILNYPNATWACALTGEGGNSTAWQELQTLAQQHAVRDFPIVGPTVPDAQPEQLANPQGKYNVIGFAHFEIVSVGQASQLSSGTVKCTVPSTATLPFNLMACVGAPNGAVYANDAKATPGNVKLTVDSAGNVTSWSAVPSTISFSYDTLFGSCGGFPPPNSSAHCLELKWNGSTLDVDQSQNGGADFGIQGVSLIR